MEFNLYVSIGNIHVAQLLVNEDRVVRNKSVSVSHLPHFPGFITSLALLTFPPDEKLELPLGFL